MGRFLFNDCLCMVWGSLVACLCAVQEPTLRLCVIHLKYADWRETFLASWVEVGVLGCGASCADRADKLLQAMELTCSKMDGVDTARGRAWAENLGYQISFVSSPLSMLMRLGVLKKCPLGRRGGMRLGVLRKAKFARCCNPNRRRVRKVLLRWVELADAIGEVPAPRSCQDWVQQHHKVMHMMRKHKPALLTPGCRIKPCSNLEVNPIGKILGNRTCNLRDS